MMPWNPIHRYAGLQSSFDTSDGATSDPFGPTAPHESADDQSFGYADGVERPVVEEPVESIPFAGTSRKPLGFVDVRADSAWPEPVHEHDQEDEPVAPEWFGRAGQSDEAAFEETEKVPFYKREISFGRKKNGTAHADDQTDEPSEEEHAEPMSEPAHVAEDPFVTAQVDATAAHELADEEKVPFFKREISFGRKKEAQVEQVDALAGEHADAGPEEAEADSTPVEPEPDAIVAHVDEPQPDEPPAADDEPDEVHADDRADDSASTFVVAAAAGASAMDDLQWPEDEAADDEPELVAEADVDELDADEPAIEAEPVVEPESQIQAESAEHDESDADDGHEAVEPESIESPVVAAEEPVQAPVPIPPPSEKPSRLGRKPKSTNGARTQRRGSGRVIGLKIGASQLAAAVVEEHNGRPEVVELARTPLEAGIVVDGEIRDPEALANALRTFFADQKLPTKDIRIGIASNRIGVRTFEIAGVEEDDRFDNAVRFKAHEVLPIAVDESVLDYRVLDERRAPTGEATRRILLVVAPREQVAPYAEVAQQAGLKLAGIDLEALGLLRAFVEPQEPGARKSSDTATVVVAIGHEASTLLVAGGGVCEFTRVFDWGGGALQEAIAQELEVPPAEAGTILRHLSLSGASARIEGLDEEARNKAIEAVRLRLTPFARELVSSLQFYQTQPDSLGIGEIVITGGTSQLGGLSDALHQMIGVSVRVGDPLQRVAVRKGAEAGFEQVIGSLAVSIGLGIDDGAVRGVNLMPRDLAKKSTRSMPKLSPKLVPIAAMIPIAALGFLYYQGHSKVSDRQSQLTALQTQLAAMPKPKGPQIDAALQGLQAQRASAVALVLGSRPSWDAMLADFSRVLPANVWLTTLSAKTSNPLSTPTAIAGTTTTAAATTPTAAPTTTTPTGVTISGYTYTQADVAALLARLSALPTLQNVQLQAAQLSTVGKKDVISFTILADMSGAGGGA
jgi:type IV pilus assembly protein PilM